jgi:hypothetical protein
MNLARIRKAIVGALGIAVTLALTIPEDALPEGWRPWVGIILGLGTVAGIYQVRNDQPAAKAVEPTRIAEPGERPAHGPREKWHK